MKFTGSISRGKTAEKHNMRECYGADAPANIDRARSGDNVVLVDRSLADVYVERFGAALADYNEQQVAKGHAERQIPDYLEKVRMDKKLNPMYEFVVQVGNVDEHPDVDVAVAVYEEWLSEFEQLYGKNFEVKQAVVHLDEATPHMHVELVPVAESKRGLRVQNSMSKAVVQAGFEDYKAMLAGWDEVLTEVMERHGIERVAGDRERQLGGVDIETYRRTMATKAERDNAREQMQAARRETAEETRRLEEVRQRVEDAQSFCGAGAGEIHALPSKRAIAAEQRRLEDERRELEDERRELGKRVAILERRASEARDKDGRNFEESRAADRAVDDAQGRAIAAFGRAYGDDGRGVGNAGDARSVESLVGFLTRCFRRVAEVAHAVKFYRYEQAMAARRSRNSLEGLLSYASAASASLNDGKGQRRHRSR